jgi:Flp pilus assembly protein TadG
MQALAFQIERKLMNWFISRRRHGAIVDFCSDRSAVAAIEFAMVLPVLFPVLLGLVELTSGLAVNRKVVLVAQTLSDLTSQSATVSTTDISGYLITGGAVLTPYSSTPLTSTITQLYVDPNTLKAKVSWSTNTSIHPVGSTTTVTPPDALKIGGTYLILAEVSYKYVPSVAYFLSSSGVTLSAVAYTRPRQSSCVTYPTNSTPC